MADHGLDKAVKDAKGIVYRGRGSFQQKVWMLENWQQQYPYKTFPVTWDAPEVGQKFIDSFLDGKGKIVPVTVIIQEGHS